MTENKATYQVGNAAFGFTAEQVALLSRTIAAGASEDDLNKFLSICQRTQLDPFARQLFLVKRWNNREGRYIFETQVSIDGFRLVASRTDAYQGQHGPYWCGPDGKWFDVWLQPNPPSAAKVGVDRKGFNSTLFSVALWSEYAQTNKEGGVSAMWAKLPANMLAKCAESLALRRAFPQELSDIYSAEELAQATNEAPVPVVKTQALVVQGEPEAQAPTGSARQQGGDDKQYLIRQLSQLVVEKGYDWSSYCTKYREKRGKVLADNTTEELRTLIASVTEAPARTAQEQGGSQ